VVPEVSMRVVLGASDQIAGKKFGKKVNQGMKKHTRMVTVDAQLN